MYDEPGATDDDRHWLLWLVDRYPDVTVSDTYFRHQDVLHVVDPEFFTFHVFVNDEPAVTLVPSAYVSDTNVAPSPANAKPESHAVAAMYAKNTLNAS